MSEHKSNRRQAPKWGRFLTRINILLAVVLGLFIILILRLGHLQIVQGEDYTELVRATETSVIEQGVPRGYIVDRNGKLLVDNTGNQAISYTRGPSVSAEDMIKVAENLAPLIEVDTESLTERDRKDFWAAKHTDQLNDRLTDAESQLGGSELYDVQLSKITEADINFTPTEVETAAIFKKMNSASSLSTVFIKNTDVTEAEIARVTEQSTSLPGIDTGMDWERSYPQDGLLRSILGEVTTETEGLPADQADALRALGYARNDRVGKSYIESEYESILRGSKTRAEIEVNNSGEVIRSEETYAGEMGDTVVLTVDTELQRQLEALATEYLETREYEENNKIFIIVSDPRNGEILSMVGKSKTEDDEIEDYALGNITYAMNMGSAVKGATVAAGYHYDILDTDSDNILTDEPINFAGSPEMASWWTNMNGDRTPRELSDTMALAQSSNVYMVKLALALGGVTEYTAGMDLGDYDYFGAIGKLRNIYQQFGLGVSTGIDLDNEETGIINPPIEPGNALTESFGQYDTYTPMQLNQYVSTVANDGVRMASHVFKGAQEAGTTDENDSQMVYEDQPTVLNRVELEQAEIERIQEGFWSVVHEPQGLAYNIYDNYPVEIAGKSGTAEVNPEEGTENSTFIGYGPYDDPEVAVTIAIPNMNINVQAAPSAQTLSKDVFDIYFGLNEQAETEEAE